MIKSSYKSERGVQISLSVCKRVFVTLFFACTLFGYTEAKYKPSLGKIDRSTWPYKINSVSEFDFASAMEMLVFAGELNRAEQITNVDSLKSYLRLKSVKIESVNKYITFVKRRLVHNFSYLNIDKEQQRVKLTTVDNWNTLLDEANILEQKLPANMLAWYNAAKRFYSSYVYEQLRLAALFPRITSEILTLDDTEINGSRFGDKQFLLTFDDGPTVKGGNTDKLISVLRQNGKIGLFFVLGNNLKTRVDKAGTDNVNNLYRGMLVGSHSRVHKAHPRYKSWKSALDYTDSLINSSLNRECRYFRPPYGQRNTAIINHLKKDNTQVMLWNIDSQDWNSKINSAEVSDRVLSLMLVWRRGILLFHDIHSKSRFTLPKLWNDLEGSGIIWIDSID
jgi:peptidoglycan/xylan/chitin deacetylase (PgdA/CDA1 family)